LNCRVRKGKSTRNREKNKHWKQYVNKEDSLWFCLVVH